MIDKKETVKVLYKHKTADDEETCREVTIVSINYSVSLKSNYKKETLKYMSNLGLAVLEETMKLDGDK